MSESDVRAARAAFDAETQSVYHAAVRYLAALDTAEQCELELAALRSAVRLAAEARTDWRLALEAAAVSS